MDKAISWPLSQENFKTLPTQALSTEPRQAASQYWAPLQGEAVDLALFLPIGFWSKNEQHHASHAGYGAAADMNGLSTDCSTVFVRKRKARA
ncbi:hypothetical protein NTD84_29840 [Pseudomonas sp. 14P_8.1_Bac3]|uniref:hypothetical protein n=1 Tax=Pseudomonas sp. 14P_8.1_Bac3 TaxID=2971621 RepID=UPI0021CA2D9E|nr:hypothetical protein [Pseudomonas sp. 14P_8.1_Bac3]MCU1763904.1 hypothetical protein [Pseudomonas sp. 14P_8.1_Bac3]